MRAMILESPPTDLVARDLPLPAPAAGQVRVRVEACGVCRTDLHIRDGELTRPKLPLVLGHEIVGIVDAIGADASTQPSSIHTPSLHASSVQASSTHLYSDDARKRRAVEIGDRVGIPWLGWTCGQCVHCSHDRENLCEQGRYVGYQMDGGYAEFVLAWSDFCIPLPKERDAAHLAPLLCAGLIGYRTYRHSWPGDVVPPPLNRVGMYGFGAAAHVVAQVVIQDGGTVYGFTRPGDAEAKQLALDLGATWAGGSDESPPEPLDAALIFAPVGSLVPHALRAVRAGGTVVCGGIHMSDIPSFPYEWLWQERVLRSVANLTRRDAHDFFQRIESRPVRTEIETFPLERANEALSRLRAGRIRGAAVLVP